MANLITLTRLLLVFVIVAIALYAEPFWQLLNVPLVVINILLDGLDGWVARRMGKATVFGAVFDIAADRIIEITLWIILAQIGMVSIWVAIIFLTRGFLVDSLRATHSSKGKMPFDIMETETGKFLVASRFMRFTYGFLKLITFSWLFALLPIVEIWPQVFIGNYYLLGYVNNILVYTLVIICLLRGIPVVLEAFNNRNDL